MSLIYLTGELQRNFLANQPKIVFCQDNKASDVKTALINCQLDTKIVTFDKGTKECHFSQFMTKYCNDDGYSVESFK